MAPAPRRASLGLAGRGARRPQGAAQLAVRGASTWTGAGEDPSWAQRAAPGPALPAPRAARAQSGSSQRRDPPPRLIRTRIFRLVGRPSAARQPASIGRALGDAGLPLGFRGVRLGRRPAPSWSGRGPGTCRDRCGCCRIFRGAHSRPPSGRPRTVCPDQGLAGPMPLPWFPV